MITALAGTFATYQISANNIAAERQQSSTEFQRDERVDAYGHFIAKALALEGVEQKVSTTRYSRPIGINQQSIDELNEAAALNDEWQAASDQLRNAAAAVELIGSGMVRLRAFDLLDAHYAVSFAFTDMSVARMRIPADQKAIDTAVEQFESKRKDAAQVRFIFSDAASSSLGISVLGP